MNGQWLLYWTAQPQRVPKFKADLFQALWEVGAGGGVQAVKFKNGREVLNTWTVIA